MDGYDSLKSDSTQANSICGELISTLKFQSKVKKPKYVSILSKRERGEIKVENEETALDFDVTKFENDKKSEKLFEIIDRDLYPEPASDIL